MGHVGLQLTRTVLVHLLIVHMHHAICSGICLAIGDRDVCFVQCIEQLTVYQSLECVRPRGDCVYAQCVKYFAKCVLPRGDCIFSVY